MKKRIAILGSTGSIGTNTLDVLSAFDSGFEVVALSCESNFGLLARQARRFRPKCVCIGDGVRDLSLKRSLPSGVRIVSGCEGLREIASRGDVDILVLAISGMAALPPLVEAVRTGKRIALANKEALVSAGPLIVKLAGKNGAEIIPVDSEHSAIFQCIEGKRKFLSRIILTASGGPLLDISSKKFDSLARRDILKHPKWKMGEKITIDSATMMNKGLEIIEAQHLFDVTEDRIEVLIHPEAIIHSMVEFLDGAILAQLALPDMRLPIQYALTYPVRRGGRAAVTDLSKIGKLSFREPDIRKFPCLELARAAARAGGTCPAVLCAADEEAVSAYLDGRIKFSGIPKVVGRVIARHKNIKREGLSLGDILRAGEWAKEEARAICCH
ncbi:MAG: 1-deoxy-D-xylulose-5-phosphate reductoisomerase [Candidatus Omnitrophica bacterium]|nr:1-deoxy-D-xylulose-5-phosphate reductoisomerase [Candidatus Omnitrophota bacterium]MDD5437177.1 1-deoxy-D-xylulose-5-phosphate reductoisomerase [Candidatus Omnitrophota bacterium]